MQFVDVFLGLEKTFFNSLAWNRSALYTWMLKKTMTLWGRRWWERTVSYITITQYDWTRFYIERNLFLRWKLLCGQDVFEIDPPLWPRCCAISSLFVKDNLLLTIYFESVMTLEWHAFHPVSIYVPLVWHDDQRVSDCVTDIMSIYAVS